MSNLRAEIRRTRREFDRHRLDRVPMVPGIIPDREPETLATAMQQAHEELPDVPGTQVNLGLFPLDEGLRVLVEVAHYSADQIDQLRAHAAAVGGTDPHVVIAARLPHERRHR